MDTVTVKASAKFYNTTLTSDMIFTKADTSISDDQIEKFSMELNIHYKACFVSLIYLFNTRLYLSFAVQKLAKFSSNIGKVHFEGLVYLLK